MNTLDISLKMTVETLFFLQKEGWHFTFFVSKSTRSNIFGLLFHNTNIKPQQYREQFTWKTENPCGLCIARAKDVVVWYQVREPNLNAKLN